MSEIDKPPRPNDPESFRRALVHLLTRARAHGVDVSDRSWKCVGAAPGQTWDVQISAIVDDREETDTEQ